MFSIFFVSSVISTDIKKGIITNLLGYLFICLGISIISTYSRKMENQCFIYTSNSICKYDPFSFQPVIFSLLSIVIVFTLILLVILNSNYLIYFIIIFSFHDSKIRFNYTILFNFIFLALIVTYSHPVTVSFFSAQWCRFTVNIVGCYSLVFLFPRFPWLWPFIHIAAYIWTTFLNDHIFAIHPRPSKTCFWTRSLQWRQGLHLYMNGIQILITSFLGYLCLGNIQQLLLPLIIACYHPNADFGFIYQVFYILEHNPF